MQASSAVRGQRSTVVQTGRQGESVRAQTEVVANYNHCHSLTVEYFEVLRHLQVTQELAAVQECLFVPFSISPFTADKALRWRDQLRRALRRPALAPGVRVARTRGGELGRGRLPAGTVRRRAPRPPRRRAVAAGAAAHGRGRRARRVRQPQLGRLRGSPLGHARRPSSTATWGSRSRRSATASGTPSIAPGVAQRLIEDLTLELIEVNGAVHAGRHRPDHGERVRRRTDRCS